jgi:hypothetical protein
LSWAEERARILEDVKKLEPHDRLSAYSALIKMNTALYESVRGWDSWLRNPIFMDTFSMEELKEIFVQFKEICTRFLEEDVRWTGKKETGLPKLARLERETEADRRYA